jgi:hypothetical protein
MFHTIYWQLPSRAFYGTAQGRNLDSALDALTPDQRLQVWHVTEPQEHFLFHGDQSAREYVAARLSEIGSRAQSGTCRREGGQHWHWQNDDECAAPTDAGHITIWPHTETQEADRQARLTRQFEGACVQAQRLYDNEGQRRAMSAADWTGFLNPAAQRRLTCQAK